MYPNFGCFNHPATPCSVGGDHVHRQGQKVGRYCGAGTGGGVKNDAGDSFFFLPTYHLSHVFTSFFAFFFPHLLYISISLCLSVYIYTHAQIYNYYEYISIQSPFCRMYISISLHIIHQYIESVFYDVKHTYLMMDYMNISLHLLYMNMDL